MKPCIFVHGGAGFVPVSKRESSLTAVTDAVKAGYTVLMKGGSALDAAEAAIRRMENCGCLNAGCGSYLTEEGTVELDAMIMDGHTMDIGAVSCVKNIANPISLARQVMMKTPHCMLVGEGAMKFARKIGFPILNDSKALISDFSYKKYMERKMECEHSSVSKTEQKDHDKHDTVGAVVIDSRGCIAAASSTGGMPYKMCGRVGDTPLVGSGAYANKWAGATSTGHGESLMKVLLSREVVHNIENGDDPSEACNKAVMRLHKETGGLGGVICVDKFGKTGWAFNTKEMPWASVTDGVMKYGLYPGDEIEEKLTEHLS